MTAKRFADPSSSMNKRLPLVGAFVGRRLADFLRLGLNLSRQLGQFALERLGDDLVERFGSLLRDLLQLLLGHSGLLPSGIRPQRNQPAVPFKSQVHAFAHAGSNGRAGGHQVAVA